MPSSSSASAVVEENKRKKTPKGQSKKAKTDDSSQVAHSTATNSANNIKKATMEQVKNAIGDVSSAPDPPAAVASASADGATSIIPSWKVPLLAKNCGVLNALESVWRGWGAPEPTVWAPVVLNSEIGLPPWPGGRQARRIIRNGNRRMVVTEGLTESFMPNHPLLQNIQPEEEEHFTAGHGLGCEVFGLCNVEDGEPVPGHWLFDVIGRVADEISLRGPKMGGLLKIDHDNGGVISMDMDAHVSMFQPDLRDSITKTFVHTSPCAPPTVAPGTLYMTALIMFRHNSPQGVPTGFTVKATKLPVSLYCVQILTNAEAQHIYNYGRVGRKQIVSRLYRHNLLGVNSLRRTSVVESSKTSKTHKTK